MFVVIGAGRGIGHLVAADLAAKGANLVLAARTRRGSRSRRG